MNNKESNIELELSTNPLSLFCEAITNLASWAQGNDELKRWPRFSLSHLLSCFKIDDQDNFLTEKPLNYLLKSIDQQKSYLRGSIPEGTRITLVVLPCLSDGLPIPPSYLNDKNYKIHPYFKLLFSNPEDPKGNALGMGNMKPAPYLNLFPQEILHQCSFIVNYDDQDIKLPANIDQDTQDFLIFRKILKEKYQRLQEIVQGTLTSLNK